MTTNEHTPAASLVPRRSSMRTKTSVLVAHDLARQAADLEPGDMLPPERVLIEELQVGRGTLREALRLLELQGVVTIKAGPGGGPVVARPDHRALSYSLALALQGTGATFLGLITARRSVEAELARLAATSRTKADLKLLWGSIVAMEAGLSDEEAFLAENLRFHELCARAARNRILELFHASLKDLSDGHAIGVSYTLRNRGVTLAAHEEIVRAVDRGEPREAYDAMASHMDEYQTLIRRKYPELLNRPIQWLLSNT